MIKICNAEGCEHVLVVGKANITTKALFHGWGITEESGTLRIYCPTCNVERIKRIYGRKG